MHKRLFYLIIASSVLAAACKKKELLVPAPEVVGGPSFTCNMNVDGLPVMIGAGVNNYYMYSSYTQSGSVYSFKGELKPMDCTGSCLNSLSIAVRDAQLTSPGQSTDIAKGLSTNYYVYSKGSYSTTAWKFDMVAEHAANLYQWNFGNGHTASTLAASDTFFHPGNYTICLTTTNAGCTANSCNTFQFKTPYSDCIVDGIYAADVLGVTTFSCNVLVGSAPISYLWDFGDGNTSPQAAPGHVYAAPGTYQVSVQVTDGTGNTTISRYDYIKAPYAGCTANMRMTSVTPITNPDGFSNIVLTWTNAAGSLYTSDNAAQPANSYFQILSTEDYTNNENGQRTKKIHVKFDCMVYNGINSIHLSNADAVIAVAYK